MRVFTRDRPYREPGAAADKLLEIANGIETVQAGRIPTGTLNAAFIAAGGTPEDYRAAIARALEDSMIDLHKSGTFITFTPKGAERFA